MATNRYNMGLTRLEGGILYMGGVLSILYVLSLTHYLLFHSLAEIMSVMIAIGIFMVTWNSRRFINNSYYTFIGLSFMSVGTLRIIHALSYDGMGVFLSGHDPNLATQLWLISQYILSLSFLVAPFLINKKIPSTSIVLFYLIVLIFSILSIFQWKIFPAAFIDGQGLTPFKIYSEYLISIFFIASLLFTYHQRKKFDSRVITLLTWALLCLTVSELIFTLYENITDFFNMLAHLVGIVGFYLFYVGIVELALMKPYRLLFKELKDRETDLRFEKDRLKIILDTMVDGVSITNPDCEITYINPALQKDFGPWKPGQKCYQYLYDASEICQECQKDIIFGGETLRREQFYSKSGKYYDLIDSPLIAPDGTVTKMAIYRDITEKKKVEKSKDEFISFASHQLRTPLSSISLSSELLLRGTFGKLDAEKRQYLEEIYNSTKRMSVLISNFLNISRIEMGNFHLSLEPTNISYFVGQIVREFAPMIQDKKITMTKNLEGNLPVVDFDNNILRLIIENLLSNAIRYTPSGGHIVVTTKYTIGKILVILNDNGYGIPEEEQVKVFEKFYRTEKAKETTSQGAGLGLYIVKLAVERSGAEIWFTSETGKGTTFYLSIPVNKNSPNF